MIAIDSWLWLEFFLSGKRRLAAEQVLRQAEQKGGILSALALAEIWYSVAKQHDATRADQLLDVIEHFPKLKIVPVVSPIAKLAAQLRLKYYSPQRQLSYADAVHLATAMLTNAAKFVTGDEDFRGMSEIAVEIV